MRIRHPDNQNKIEDLPDHENVAVPDPQFQYDEDQKMSAQKLGERAQENPGHLKYALVGGVVTAIVAAGGYLGIKGMNSGEDGNAKSPAPTPDTATSAPASNTESESNETVGTDIDFESVDLTLESDPALVAETFNDMKNAWIKQGATSEFNDNNDYSVGTEAYARAEAEKTDDLYADMRYIKDWRDVPSLVENYENIKELHAMNLYMYLITSSEDPADLEPYNYNSSVEGIDRVEKDEDSLSMFVTTNAHDNRDKNRAGEYISIDHNDMSGTTGYVYVIEDGKMKIADVILQ